MANQKIWKLIGLTVILLLAGVPAAHAQDAPAATLSPEDLLRRMSEELKSAEAFRFHAEINFDDVLISGQKLKYAGAVDVTVKRPNGIYIDYRDDLSAKRFWYDGKTGTLLDVPSSKYSTASLPGEIDAAVELLQDRYALELPLVDMISSDSFALISSRALAWGYVGVNDVDGTPAHHVAIMGENRDLQLWIRVQGSPLPLKLVLTYKNTPRAPQYEAVITDWEVGAELPAATFKPALPEGAQQIEFLVAEGQQ